MSKKILFSLLILVILSIGVSASGLRLEESNLTISKMFEEDYQIAVTIINDENFTFKNIGFEEDFVSMTPLTLNPFQNATVGLIVSREADFSGELTLRGEYETNIGKSNKTIEINIDYTNGLSICNLDLIIGDKIQWNNNVLDEIVLKGDTDFATILKESNYTKEFNYVEEFDYYAKRNGAKFTEECRINVMDDSGWVHSLDYDHKVPTDIKINYEPTTVSINFIETEYTVNYNSEQEDIFSIKNTGYKPGKKIYIESDWVKFEPNNFDLAVGESKTIKYTIKPSIYMTNQTNKTYGLDVKIHGNFDDITRELNITIPYAKINTQYSSSVSDPEFFHNLYTFVCGLTPEHEDCIKTTQCTGSATTIEYTQETITGLLNAESKRQDEQTLYQKQDLEEKRILRETLNSTNIKLKDLFTENKDLREQLSKANSTQKLVIAFVLFLLIGFMAYSYFTSDARKDVINNNAKLEKGELVW